MVTIVKAVPGFMVVAQGNNMVTAVGQYLVSQIGPYPNANLIVGNTYHISDPAHIAGIVVALHTMPGGGMQTATFVQQT